MTMHPSGRHIPDATGWGDDNEAFATAYSETHTKCSGCGTSVTLPEFCDTDTAFPSERCSCGAITCLDCLDVGGCGGTQCDRMADRYDDDYYRWEER